MLTHTCTRLHFGVRGAGVGVGYAREVCVYQERILGFGVLVRGNGGVGGVGGVGGGAEYRGETT